MAIELLRSFLQQATATGSKSTVLTDLRWFIGIISSAFLVSLGVKAPFWVTVFLACILGLACLIYFAAYIYFGLKSPDSLRSEKFTLSKLAIERSVTGDNISGFIDPMLDKGNLHLPASTPKELKE